MPKFRIFQTTKGIALYLAILVLATRLPYFFEATIDWDESTFILLGQSVVDGHLPYTDLLDVKPPLLWFFFALFIVVFGKTIASIRLAGSVCVFLTALMTYRIGCQIWRSEVGIVAGSLFIILTGLSPSGQAVMSEHIALVPLTVALTLTIVGKNNLPNYFFIGVSLAIAALVRLNLIYAAIAIGSLAIFYPPKGDNWRFQDILRSCFACISGGLSIVFLTLLPYIILDREELWWSGTIGASLSYAGSQNDPLSVFGKQLFDIFNILRGRISLALIGVFILVWLGSIFQILDLADRYQNLEKSRRRSIVLLLATIASIEISILKGGFFYGHYWIQFNSILSLFAAASIYSLYCGSKKRIPIYLVVFLSAIVFFHISFKYFSSAGEIIRDRRLFYGQACDIARFLERENPKRQPVLLLDSHIAYWLTDSKPLIPTAAHPSNLTKEFLLKTWLGKDASIATELTKIAAIAPKFIIGERLQSFFPEPARSQFNRTLAEHYLAIEEEKIDGVEIYEVRENRTSLQKM